MANKKVNELTPVLEDAKDDVVESFTKGFDAAIDQATFPQGNRLIQTWVLQGRSRQSDH